MPPSFEESYTFMKYEDLMKMKISLCTLYRVQTLIKNKWHRGNLKLMCEFAHLKFTANLGEFSEQNNGRDTKLGEI